MLRSGTWPTPRTTRAATVVGERRPHFRRRDERARCDNQDVTAHWIHHVFGAAASAEGRWRCRCHRWTAYVVGGYNGPSLDPGVLATIQRGQLQKSSHSPCAGPLPRRGRLHGLIYIFGGETSVGVLSTSCRWSNPSRDGQASWPPSHAIVGRGGRRAGRRDLHSRWSDRFRPSTGQSMMCSRLTVAKGSFFERAAGRRRRQRGCDRERRPHAHCRRRDYRRCPDAIAQVVRAYPLLRCRRVAGRRFSVLRRQVADRRPRQRPPAPDRRHRQGHLDLPLGRTRHLRPEASISPTMPSSSVTARRSSRTRRRTTR